ncbi:phage holin family protein [Schinkia azotoformans]|uniref:phage holin family protein n=1 Tax=Schinkia azotoformans TaxID=1454 RepID=UPI002DBE732F|nr:phage holin family protein [Schinkia azotoformans]MEC1720525.1 phage holin family protein [Schinkia azotoformans]MED4353877.1 phage holin family protein [Schinkia azotoformans]MED4414061.1 phage holin family protein [Schinkia azotoformans]
MDTFIQNLKMILALLGGYLGSFLGIFDSLIYALVAFVSLDYLTGILLAIYEKKLSSNIGFKSIFKKILIFVLVSVGNIIDQYIISTGSTIRTMIIMFYLTNEGISILENTAKMGVPFPQKLKDILQQIGDTYKK